MAVNGNQNVHQEAIFGRLKSGDVTLEVSGAVMSLNLNDIFFIAPNNKYKLSGSADAVVNVVSLNFTNPTAVTQDFIPQSIIRALMNGHCTTHAVIRNGDAGFETIYNCMNIVTKAETERQEFFQLLVYAKMYEMFYELFANDYVKITDAETKSKKYRALMRVTNYIDEHYSDGVSLEEVALATGISRYYVSHLFKELMNTTFVGYVCQASIICLTSTARLKCILTELRRLTEKHNFINLYKIPLSFLRAAFFYKDITLNLFVMTTNSTNFVYYNKFY